MNRVEGSRGRYQLNRVRTVHLAGIACGPTYDDDSEEMMEDVSDRIAADPGGHARTIMPDAREAVAAGPLPSPLPPLTWVARLYSPRPVGSGDPERRSELTICWFAGYESHTVSIDDMVMKALEELDWEERAG